MDLTTEESCGDINSVASVLKAWFRELPEPLLTRKLYPEFVRIASIQDETEKLTSLHLCTNSLPDPNYATLKFLMCHLNRYAIFLFSYRCGRVIIFAFLTESFSSPLNLIQHPSKPKSERHGFDQLGLDLWSYSGRIGW